MIATGQRSLPQWAVDVVAYPPRTGGGFHNWIFRAARALWKCGRNESDIGAIIESAALTCGRRVRNSEIVEAIKNSHTTAFKSACLQSHRQPWPSLNTEQREAIIDDGGLVDLWETSPARLDNNETHTEAIIERLFPGDPLLCVGRSNSEFATRPRSIWRNRLSRLQFIVPSPMSARSGRTQDGNLSEHTLENTGPRRFLVVEFDTGTVDEHAALLLHLAERDPLVLAVHSGGKSLHGWFYFAWESEQPLRRFMRYAVSLGADRATWTRSQFVRMPDGLRDDGKRQTIYFFNPEVMR